MDAKTALKHWIKMLVKHQIGIDEVKAREKDLTIEELLAKTHFNTLQGLKAETAIEELLTAHPDAEAYYRGLYDEVLDELRREHA